MYLFLNKLYLINTQKDVQKLSIAHGFNIIGINKIYRIKEIQIINLFWKFGLGVVVAHPESTIRNKTFNEKHGFTTIGDGYFISGMNVNIAGTICYKINKSFGIQYDLQITLARVNIPIYGGHADINNIALHNIFSIYFKL